MTAIRLNGGVSLTASFQVQFAAGPLSPLCTGVWATFMALPCSCSCSCSGAVRRGARSRSHEQEQEGVFMIGAHTLCSGSREGEWWSGWD